MRARDVTSPTPSVPDVRAQFIIEMTRCDRALRRYLFTLLTCDYAVEEVMQETALTLWEKADEYDPGRPFFPWACRLAYFKVLEYRKRSRCDRLEFRPNPLRKSVTITRLVRISAPTW